MSTCRSCGAPVVWAYTESGKRMPVDSAPHPRGNLMLHYDQGTWRVSVVPTYGPGLRHRPHFATCPDAESWRKR